MRSKEIGGMWWVLGFVALFVFCCWAIYLQGESDKGIIKTWAEDNDYSIVTMEKTIFDHGPFWFVDDHDRIYKVVILDHHEKRRTSYFWFGVWNHEQRWYD